MTAPRSRFAFVFFDVGSTLVRIEGFDLLAGDDPEIARLTREAMNGEIPMEEIYAQRLERIRPTRRQLEQLAERYVESLTPGAEETVAALRAAGAHVQIVSAGMREALFPLAEKLGLPARSVHAVSLVHDDEGNYVDFDRRSLLVRNGGKELTVLSLLARSKGASAFVGDGVTDLETKKVVDLFVGFGGVRVRETVRQNAAVYVTEPSLTAVLPYLLEER